MQVVGQHHVGFAVQDLDRAIGFLRHFGFVVTRRLDVDELDVAFLDHAGVTVELLHHRGGDGDQDRVDRVEQRAHLCLQVADIDAAHAEVVATGLEALSPPNDEPALGLRWLFVRGPDGLRVELLERDRR
jgi:catechol 2,3-dioxygenase-like lactoylglutathione lyase family enzyme